MRHPIIALLVALAAAGCTTMSSRYSDISDYAETPSEFHIHAFGRAGEIRQEDRYFVFDAGVGDLYDIVMAEIVERKSDNPAIKDLARGVLGEAGARNRRLTLIAEQHIGIEPPTLLDRALAARRDRLAVLSGDAFDGAYLRDRVARSERAIAVYRDEASGGSEPLLTQFAAEMLPGLESEKRAAAGLAATVAR